MTNPLTVYYRLSGTAARGTDYTLVSGTYNSTDDYGSVVIPANQTQTTLQINITNDGLMEMTESVIVSLPRDISTQNGPITMNYERIPSFVAQGYIVDNDQWQVNVTSSASGGAETKSNETARPLVFTVSRTGETDLSTSLTVYYTLGGTSSYGKDYTLASVPGSYNALYQYGTLTIPANQSSANLSFNVIHDGLVESLENVTLTLLNDSIYSTGSQTFYRLGNTPSATNTISDNDIQWDVKVEPQVSAASETVSGTPLQPAVYRFTRTGSEDLSQSLNIYYELAGTATLGSDFTIPNNCSQNYDLEKYIGYVTIPANAAYVDLTINVMDDSIAENAESLIVRLMTSTASDVVYRVTTPSSAQLTLADNDDIMQVSAGGPYEANEGDTVTLSASAVLDPYGDGPWTYAWDLDNDGVYETSGQEIEYSTIGLNGIRTRTIHLRATDPQNHSATAQTTLTLHNVVPEITLNDPVCTNGTLVWTGSFTDTDTDTWTGTIDFGDGTASQSVTLGSDKTFTFSHVYTDAGFYTLCLSIGDGETTATQSRRVMIGTLSQVLEVACGEITVTHQMATSIPFSTNSVPYNDAKILEFTVENVSNTDVAIDVFKSTFPNGVEFYRTPLSPVIPAGETVDFALKWDARQTLTSLDHVTQIALGALGVTFDIPLAGVVNRNLVTPTVTNVALLYDSGNSSTDKITYNPSVTGTISGELTGGSVRVEFDHENDDMINGSVNVYASGNTFTYDPSLDSGWVPLTSGSRGETLRYRVVHLDHNGETITTGSWASFSHTLTPPPAGTVSVSNLSMVCGDGGDWTTTGAAAVTGSVSGSNLRAVEVRIGTCVSRTRVTSAGTFTATLPCGLDYGVSTTVEVRGISYLSSDQMNVAGSWSSLSVIPTAPAVATLTLKNGTTSGISSDITLSGTVSSTAVDAAYSEIEIYSGTTIYARTWCNKDGAFEVTPQGLPVVDGYATETLYARVVKTKFDGTKVYGTSLSQYVKYTPAALPAITKISLDESIASGSTSTTNPAVTVTTTVPVNIHPYFAFAYKTTGDWSANQLVPGWTQSSDDSERTTDVVEGNYRMSGLRTISGSSAAVSVRVYGYMG